MLLRSFWSGRAYQRLPTHLSATKQRPWPYVQVILWLVIFLLVVAVIHLSRVVLEPRYRPLDDYQIMNNLPVVHQTRSNSPDTSRHAVVTALYTDKYAIATAVLGHSVRSVNSTARLVVLYIDGQVSQRALCICKAVGWEPIPVPRISPPLGDNSVRQQFVDQYTKLNLWGLDRYGIESVVYLDADTLVRRNFDELFDLPFNFAAVPDVYGPGDQRGFDLTFNAGVLALKPSSSALEHMKEMIGQARYPPTQAEQAFLNMYFGAKAARLPYIYNANIAIKHRSEVVWRELKKELSIVHYTMFKPFLMEVSGKKLKLCAEEIEKALESNAQPGQREWAEEFEWWRIAFRHMMKDKEADIAACSR